MCSVYWRVSKRRRAITGSFGRDFEPNGDNSERGTMRRISGWIWVRVIDINNGISCMLERFI